MLARGGLILHGWDLLDVIRVTLTRQMFVS